MSDTQPKWDDINFVRLYITHHSSMDENIETFDPELFMKLCANVKFPIFLENGNVYKKEELFDKYPFIKSIGKTPEDLFAKQIMTIYEEKNVKGEVVDDLTEYIITDEGKDNSSVKDQLFLLKNNGKGTAKKPTKIIETNIYIARDKWKHFLHLDEFRSTICAFKDVKLLANSPMGTLLIEDSKQNENEKSSLINDSKLNQDNAINHNQSDHKSSETMAANLSIHDNIVADGNVSHHSGIVKESIIAPITKNKIGVNGLTFIIYPLKKQFDLFSKVNLICESKMADAGIDIPVPADINIPSFMETHGIAAMIDLEIKAVLIDEKGDYHSYFLMPRSSISKTPLSMANSVGLVDCTYRGNVKAAVRNLSSAEYKCNRGTSLFQLVPRIETSFKYVIVDEKSELFPLINETVRGSGGFGSTGARGNS